MSFDVLKFLRDYRIPYVTEGNKHCRTNWIQVHCPFCAGSQNYHLGLNLSDDRASCWRCRGKSIFQVIKALARCGQEDVKQIYSQYSGRSAVQDRIIKPKIRSESRLPVGTEPLKYIHDDYLIARKFDPERLERTYGLQGTGRHAYVKVDDSVVDYRYRIIAPIRFENKLVSFQGRDVTGTSGLRYKACPQELEVIDHKNILYGYDLVTGDTALVQEGITDNWRFGPGSLATFGTGFKAEQIRVLVRRFKRLFVMFDPEPTAQQVADELAWALGVAGREAILVELDSPGIDPGELEQSEADAMMREMGLKGWNI